MSGYATGACSARLVTEALPEKPADASEVALGDIRRKQMRALDTVRSDGETQAGGASRDPRHGLNNRDRRGAMMNRHSECRALVVTEGLSHRARYFADHHDEAWAVLETGATTPHISLQVLPCSPAE